MKKYYFLITIFFCTNYLFANHPLLERANDGPRWLVKKTTIIDCRRAIKGSYVKNGKSEIRLGVHIIDVSNEISVYFTGVVLGKDEWDIFQYKIYEENDRTGISETRLKNLYEDNNEIRFFQGETEYVFNKNTMMISYKNIIEPRKCRYL